MKIIKRYSIYKNLVLLDSRSEKLSFNSDGRKHYVYRVTDKIMNEHYYGSRTSKQENIIMDFWKYGTSSDKKKIILESKDNFKIKIIKIFDNAGDKMLYESYLHQYFNVKQKDNNFWNRANQTPFGFDTTGKVTTKNIRDKISKANKGKTRSIETKILMSKNWTDSKKRSHSEAMKGERNPMFLNGHSEKTKSELRERWNKKENKIICSERAKLGWNEERKIKQSNLFSGDNNPSKRREVQEKMSKAWTEERKTECTCKYCGMKNNKTNHKRWHGENCKHKIVK